MTLDDIDLKIIRLLEMDGRLSHAAIGKEIGLTGPSVYARVQRMEREGIIRGYTTLLDAAKMGRGLVAFVRVSTNAPVEGQDIEEFISHEPQIAEAYDVDGEDSYILKIQTDTPQSLRDLLSQIRRLPGVTRTVTSISLFTVKEAGTNGLNITR